MKYASLCVLSYNRPGFLKEMIEGLRTQADYPFELIVHDDGSDIETGTYGYLHELQAKGEIGTLIYNRAGHNQGVGTAMKRMFGLASGDPIIKLDQDLVFGPDWLSDTVAILEQNQRDVVNGRHWGGGATGEVKPIGALGAFKYHAEPVHHETMHVADNGYWHEVQDFVGSFIAVPRRVYERMGPFEEHSDAFAEDITFKKQLQAAGYALALPPHDLCSNRGFGPGPSTVVYADRGEIKVSEINHEPHVYGR